MGNSSFLRKATLDQILAASFETKSEQAGAVLFVLGHTSDEERLDLMEHVLSTYGLAQSTRAVQLENLPKCGLSGEVFEEVVRRISTDINQLIDRLATGNSSCRQVASDVLEHLDKMKNSDERTVGLALIMHSDLIPYVVLPTELFQYADLMVVPDTVYDQPSVRKSRAQVARLCSPTASRLNLNLTQTVTALRRILESHTAPMERDVVFRTILSSVLRIGEARGMMKAQLQMAAAALAQTLVVGGESLDCGNPNCPCHQKQRSAKSGDAKLDETSDVGGKKMMN